MGKSNFHDGGVSRVDLDHFEATASADGKGIVVIQKRSFARKSNGGSTPKKPFGTSSVWTNLVDPGLVDSVEYAVQPPVKWPRLLIK